MKAKLREVLERFAEAIGDTYMLETWKAGQDNSVSMARDEALAAIVEMMPRWVPVSERLPEVDEWVLGSAKPFPLVMRRFNPADGGGWFWQIWSVGGIVSATRVTHWQHIPTPPEAEKDAHETES